jgi:hypothetical protein
MRGCWLVTGWQIVSPLLTAGLEKRYWIMDSTEPSRGLHRKFGDCLEGFLGIKQYAIHLDLRKGDV